MNRFHKMKTRNTFSSALTLCALAVGLVAAVVWNGIPVSAIGEVDGRPQFGVVSLAAGQTARLNVAAAVALGEVEGRPPRASKVTLAFDVYAPATATEPTATDDAASAACVNKLEFLRRESCEVTLRPGEVASLEFTAPQGTRISAVMFGEVEGKKKGTGDRRLRATLEVMEAGRTIFVHPGAAVGFNPQPDPPGQPGR